MVKKSTALMGAAVLALVAVGGGWWWFSRDDAPQQRWRTAKIERGPITATVSASGAVNPVTQVSVGTQVSGQIQELFVDFNSPVKAGQLIARIDPTTFVADVTRARAELDRAVADAERVARERLRVAEALGLNTTLERLIQMPGSRVINYEPSLMLALDEACRLQCRLSIETRTNAYQIRTGQFPEAPISVYFTVRQYWGHTPGLSFVDSFRHQRTIGEELLQQVRSQLGPEAHIVFAASSRLGWNSELEDFSAPVPTTAPRYDPHGNVSFTNMVCFFIHSPHACLLTELKIRLPNSPG